MDSYHASGSPNLAQDPTSDGFVKLIECFPAHHGCSEARVWHTNRECTHYYQRGGANLASSVDKKERLAEQESSQINQPFIENSQASYPSWIPPSSIL